MLIQFWFFSNSNSKLKSESELEWGLLQNNLKNI